MADATLSWENARSLEDLGELTARWLEGTEAKHPCYEGRPDTETLLLVPSLAALNRSAFVTEFSQPGEPTNEGFGQRASVTGFCREDVARRLAELGLWSDLIVIAFPPGCGGGYYIPITIQDYRPSTWTGRHDPVLLEPYVAQCAVEAVDELMSSWSVSVIDPQWGRGPHLWERVADAVIRGKPTRFDTRPADDGLSTDFVW